MVKDKNISSIADDTKPNPGRVYDYFLGGDHNFEVDRILAAEVLKVIPEAPKVLRLVRWFLGEAVRGLLEDGYTQFVDFASGLPVQDHIHQIAPPGTKVVYSDIDPVTVAYALEIIGNNPDVRYLYCDIREPEIVLESDEVATLFDRKKKTAIGMNGITPWAHKGDRLYVCDWMYDSSNPDSYKSLGELQRMYAEIGSPVYFLSFEKMSRLIGQWKPTSPGYQLLEKWLGISGTQLSFSEEIKERVGSTIYGVILEKQ